MSVEQNKHLLHLFYEELFHRGNLDVVDELIPPDSVDHEQFPGLEGSPQDVLKQFVTLIRAAFPDLRIIVEDMIGEGDKVVGRARMTGTQQGAFMGIPASGKAIDVQVIDIVRFRDGKMVEHWAVTDNLGMMQQLGVMPPPDAGGNDATI